MSVHVLSFFFLKENKTKFDDDDAVLMRGTTRALPSFHPFIGGWDTFLQHST